MLDPKNTLSDDKIERRQNKLWENIADTAKTSGYIDIFSLCDVLAGDLKYDTDRWIKKLNIDTKWITKSKGLTLKHEAFNHRRGKWYYILLRLTTGLNSNWKFNKNRRPVHGYMPIYFYNNATDKCEIVSDNIRKQFIKGFDIENLLFIKLSDLEKWFTKYLKEPLPSLLFPIDTKRANLSEFQEILIKFSPDIECFYRNLKAYIDMNISNGHIKDDVNEETIKNTYTETDSIEPFEYMKIEHALKGVYKGDNPSLNIKIPILQEMILDINKTDYFKFHEKLKNKEALYKEYNSAKRGSPH